MNRLRLPVAFGASCFFSVSLFWLLRTLIGVSGALDEIEAPPKFEFVRLRKDTEVEERRRVKPQIEKPEPPPTAESVSTNERLSVIAGADAAVLVPSVDFGGVGGVGVLNPADLAASGGTDRDVLPQVRIQPDYPIQARQKGIEGWVDVQFTVGPDGSVRDPFVVAAEPERIFDRAALQAVKSWKYNPKIEDGRAVERPGLQVRIRFRLED